MRLSEITRNDILFKSNYQDIEEIVFNKKNEDLNVKLKRMPEDARIKLRETLQRIINEGSGGLICIIL